MDSKVCPVCNKDKPLSEYNKEVRSSDGLSYKCRLCRSEYRASNREGINAYNRKYERDKKGYNERFKESVRIKKLVNNTLTKKTIVKDSDIHKILGADYDTFITHLCKGFHDLYNRQPNFGVDILHVDHIIPISTAISLEEVTSLNCYTNLRYMLAKDNLDKSNYKDWKLDQKKDR